MLSVLIGRSCTGFEKQRNSSTVFSRLNLRWWTSIRLEMSGRREQTNSHSAQMKLSQSPTCHIPSCQRIESKDGGLLSQSSRKSYVMWSESQRLESRKRRGRPRSEPWGIPVEVMSTKNKLFSAVDQVLINDLEEEKKDKWSMTEEKYENMR